MARRLLYGHSEDEGVLIVGGHKVNETLTSGLELARFLRQLKEAQQIGLFVSNSEGRKVSVKGGRDT